ncbi:MAG TPA: MATE family efflux transporter [Candidatus Polarisedimenticolaceae bacterium]|nr:MATE family efflux transporter [Candidatus Polarisedimenticolaceae bacterium]
MARSPARRNEIGAMLRLAIPVVLAEIGWVAMGVVDVMMVGRIDAESIGAVSVGRAAFMLVCVFGIGLLLGLDTVVSQAYGAGDERECRLSLLHGVYLALIVTVPLMLVAGLLGLLIDRWPMDERVRRMAVGYLAGVNWSLLPVLLYVAFRRYLQAMNLVRPVMIALLSANLVNVLANWVLIFGHLGAPPLGAVGAAWATVLASAYMALFLLVAIVLHHRDERSVLRSIPWRLDPRRLGRLIGLGLPAGGQLLLEIGVFALATVLAARLAPSALAAHQIAINVASVTYMVPLGMSSAAAVRVGQALGRSDREGAASAGWTALGLGSAFMALAALVFVTFPVRIVGAFTSEAEVLRAGVRLLYVAAVFQLFDGLQVVAIGALRGSGDTRTPMVWNLVGYWLMGLPVGYYLCFERGLGVLGLWIGLSLGLIVVGTILLRTWARLTVSWRGTADR